MTDTVLFTYGVSRGRDTYGYMFIDAPSMDDWHLTQLATEN